MKNREHYNIRRQVDSLEKLLGFSTLHLINDAVTHDIPAPNQTALTNTKILLRILYKLNFLPEKVVPSGAGGITLFYYNSGRHPAMFEVQNDGKIWAAYLNGTQRYISYVDLDNFDEEIVEELRSRVY